MENKTGYFESEPGRKSSTRLQMFLTMFFAFLVIGYQVYVGKDEVDLVLAILLLTAAFAPKQIQNFSEKMQKK